MNFFLIILIIVIAVIAVILIVALFVKGDYSVERTILIDRSSDAVFDYIRYLKNQDHYNKWVMMDPDMKKSYTGADGIIGFVYAWNGNKKAGKGEQEIKLLNQAQKIDVEIRFERPFSGVAQTSFDIDTVSVNSSRVRWRMASKMKYPMNIMLAFMNMDNLLGKDLEISLKNLKTILEKGPV